MPVAATVGKARITAIDTAAAERVKGVLAVLTYRNMDRLKKVEFSFAGGQAIQSHFPMQAPEVLYRGEYIALSVAETSEAAREAASLVRATYDEQPFAVEMTAAGGTEVVQAKATAWFPDFVKGDPVPLIDAAPVSVDAIYYSPMAFDCRNIEGYLIARHRQICTRHVVRALIQTIEEAGALAFACRDSELDSKSAVRKGQPA
jgi:xanthine dehydrogenase YagR molybdenum-binding subunit